MSDQNWGENENFDNIKNEEGNNTQGQEITNDQNVKYEQMQTSVEEFNNEANSWINSNDEFKSKNKTNIHNNVKEEEMEDDEGLLKNVKYSKSH